jgi:DNA sulfur modification protein DndD
VTKQNGRIQNLDKRTETMEKRKSTIDSLISGCDSEKIRQFEAEVQEYLKKKTQLSEEVGKLKLMVRSTESRIAEMEKERNKELRNQTKYRELVTNLDFCETALAVATGAKEKVMEDVRREIEQQTNEHFLNMIWKEKTYANVEIGEDYNVSVKHVSGCESIGTLSAGERQVLALSFVSALNNVSGFDAPLIIDTPLGRISSEPRIRIAKLLPSCFPNRQVILLMTDEEYTPMVRDALKDHVSKEFSIKFTEYKDGSDAKVIENA